MPQSRINPKLLKKLAQKLGKKEKYIREQLSIRAGRLGISSEAFLILWAKKERMGTASYQRKLSENIQSEVRDTLPSFFGSVQPKPRIVYKGKAVKNQKERSSIALAIEYLIQDEELFDRCEDLIRAKKNFDRVFREATTVLEDRVVALSGIDDLHGTDLIVKALNPDLSRAVLIISNKKNEQEGLFNICKGLVLAFRNPAHHKLSNRFTRQDALKFCGFIDSLLAILQRAKKQNKP